MGKKTVLIVLVIVNIAMSGCLPKACRHNERSSFLYFHNKSDFPIYVHVPYTFPDTLIGAGMNIPINSKEAEYINYPDRVLENPEDYMPLLMPGQKDSTYFRYCVAYSIGPEGIKNMDWVYFVSYDTVQAIGWEEIRCSNRGVLRRDTLTLERMRDQSFVISYP